jgi:hypothetical protein
MNEKDTQIPKLFVDVINEFGYLNQINKTCEELLELSSALINNDRDNIIEEIVDCNNMIQQMRYIISKIYKNCNITEAEVMLVAERKKTYLEGLLLNSKQKKKG